jgi:hypothetical protein
MKFVCPLPLPHQEKERERERGNRLSAFDKTNYERFVCLGCATAHTREELIKVLLLSACRCPPRVVCVCTIRTYVYDTRTSNGFLFTVFKKKKKKMISRVVHDDDGLRGVRRGNESRGAMRNEGKKNHTYGKHIYLCTCLR